MFERSAQRLHEFVLEHSVTAILGAHIEMTSTPKIDYPDKTRFQPDEPPLSMKACHVHTLNNVVKDAAQRNELWGTIRTDDFAVVPQPDVAQTHITRVALVRQVFFKTIDGPSQADRLLQALMKAKSMGASIALLPELPMDEWYPRLNITPDSHEVCEDGLHDERIVAMSEGARRAEICVVGGALLRASSLPEQFRDGVPADDLSNDLNTVRNVTLVFNSEGYLAATHMKRHLPKEEGFWEGRHFEAAPGNPSVMRGILPGLLCCVQTCSDIMRPSSHTLAAIGAGLILNPRATEVSSSLKWKKIVSGIAATCASYVISVPRPSREGDLNLGGESFAISPLGDELVASTDDICTCDIDLLALGEARVESYPGYLNIRSKDYAAAWHQVSTHLSSFRNTY